MFSSNVDVGRNNRLTLKFHKIGCGLRGPCREPARDIPLVTKVMRKGARHTQRRDRASGVPPDILEHLPPKKPDSAYFIALCSHL